MSRGGETDKLDYYLNYSPFDFEVWMGAVNGKMMSHIVESCPLTKLNGGLSRLHSADEDAV